jgi:hypothetical protein
MLNEGKVQKHLGGGQLQAFFNSSAPKVMKAMVAPLVPSLIAKSNQSMNTATTATSAAPTSSIGMGRRRGNMEDNYFKYGGRVQRFATGGEVSYLGANIYRYNDPLYPTAGQNIVSSDLSLQALIDTNNPKSFLSLNCSVDGVI